MMIRLKRRKSFISYIKVEISLKLKNSALIENLGNPCFLLKLGSFHIGTPFKFLFCCCLFD